jgi:hypothetical protein
VLGGRLDAPVDIDELGAERRQRAAAAALAAGRRGDGGLGARAVHLVAEQPGAPVRQAQRLRRRGDR